MDPVDLSGVLRPSDLQNKTEEAYDTYMWRHVCVVCFFCFVLQIGGSEHAAEIHWVHVKEGTEDELLVVGVMFDTTEYGSNVEVRKQLS